MRSIFGVQIKDGKLNKDVQHDSPFPCMHALIQMFIRCAYILIHKLELKNPNGAM